MISRSDLAKRFFDGTSSLAYILLFLLPFQLGTFFFFDFSHIYGIRIDYLAPAVYLTDIVAILLIACNAEALRIFLNKKFFFLILLLTLNILLSQSPFIGLYRSFKILEVLALFAVFKNLKLKMNWVLYAFLTASILQLFLGLSHLMLGHSLQGIWYFLGERSFSIATPGIATVAFQGHELLRPYGTFSHPNSLAGFYLLLYSFVLFDKRFAPFWKAKYLFLGISSLLILFSFSKIALLSFLVVNSWYALRSLKKCSLCSISKIIGAVVMTLLFFSATGDVDTLNKRMYLISSAFQIIEQYPLFGVGLGNYIHAQSTFSNPYPYHFVEPVHNIFLLLVAELGIPIVLYVGYFVRGILEKLWLHDVGRAILLIVCLTGLFDHYWITLQQNLLLLPVIVSFLQKRDHVLK